MATYAFAAMFFPDLRSRATLIQADFLNDISRNMILTRAPMSATKTMGIQDL
jgi:hypothetical protein